VRTFAKYNGMAIVDLNRFQNIKVGGYDPTQSYLERTKATRDEVTTPHTVNALYDCSDFGWNANIINQSATFWDSPLKFSLSPYAPNYNNSASFLEISDDAGNLKVVIADIDDESGRYISTTTTIATPVTGSNSTITLFVKGGYLNLQIDAQVLYKGAIRRHGGKHLPKIEFVSAKSESLSVFFYKGTYNPYTPTVTDAEMWGVAGEGGNKGGNTENHPTSEGAARIYWSLFKSVDFRQPVMTEGSTGFIGTTERKVGLRKIDPKGLLHIGDGANADVPITTANNLVLEDPANVGMTLMSNNTGVARIVIADEDNNNIAGLTYSHSNDTGNLRAGGVDALTFTSSRVTLPEELRFKAEDGIAAVNNTNRSLQFTLVDDTNLRVYVRGNDGVVRFGDSILSVNVANGKLDDITTLGLLASTTVRPVGSVVRTSGYLTAGDGGGGDWKLTALTGQTVSQTPAQLVNALFNDASGKQWSLVSERINVVGLGGVLDGVTDNTLVTNAAVEWGKQLGIPIGTYSTESFYLLSKNIELIGEDRELSIIKLKDNAIQNVISMSGTGRLKASNLTLDQNFTNNSGGHGIRSGGCEQLVIENVTIQNCAFYGIGLQAGTSNGVNLSKFTIKNTNSDGIDIKDYNNNNGCIYITDYTAENISIVDADDVALDVRGEVCANNISITAVTESRGVRLRQGGSQGRAGFGTINNVIFKGYGADSTIAIHIAADAGNFTITNVSAKDCNQAILQSAGAVGGVITGVTCSGIYGDGMSIGGNDLIINGYSAKNTTGSSRLCDVESTAVNFNLCNFFIDETTASSQGIRVNTGAVDTSFANGAIRGGSIGDSGTGTVESNIRLI
jgi:hypothetical protein